MTILNASCILYYAILRWFVFVFCLLPALVQIADGWISVRLREDNGALGDILLEKI